MLTAAMTSPHDTPSGTGIFAASSHQGGRGEEDREGRHREVPDPLEELAGARIPSTDRCQGSAVASELAREREREEEEVRGEREDEGEGLRPGARPRRRRGCRGRARSPLRSRVR